MKGRAQFNMLTGVDIQIEGYDDAPLTLTVGDGESVDPLNDAPVARVDVHLSA